jgi:hypothetical protein
MIVAYEQKNMRRKGSERVIWSFTAKGLPFGTSRKEEGDEKNSFGGRGVAPVGQRGLGGNNAEVDRGLG